MVDLVSLGALFGLGAPDLDLAGREGLVTDSLRNAFQDATNLIRLVTYVTYV